MPHDTTIKQLLDFVIFKKVSTTSTKKLSPFDADDIDPTPVIRSFVLQLILKTDLQDAKDHLEDFFTRFKQGKEMEIDLCLLMVYCFEDRLLMDYGYPLDMATASRLIVEFLRTGIIEQVGNVQVVEIAKLRLALARIADEIIKILRGQNELCKSIWLKPLYELLNNDRSECFRKYLVRVVVENSRIELIELWKKHMKLNDLLPEEIKTSGPDNLQDFFLFFEEPYLTIRDGIRHDFLSGKLEWIPTLLNQHQLRNSSMMWNLSLNFLTKI